MAYLDNVYAVVQIAPTGIPTYVRLSQNENGRVLNFAVSGDALPAGSTVALTGTKPDGAVYSASGTLADNVATFNEDEQLTAVAGEWDAKVEVTNSGNLIATGRIKFVIDADPSGGNIPSDSQLDGYIAEMLSLLDAGKAEAYGSPLVASTVAGMTDQSRVYVYTGSETGYTAGNWYYWNGSSWTSGGVYNAVAVSTDTTLSIAGKAADAKATGDALDELKDDLTNIETVLDDIGVESESIDISLSTTWGKYINSQGTIDTAPGNQGVSIGTVTPGKIYLISASANFTKPYFAWYDENDSLVEIGTLSPAGSTRSNLINGEYITPSGAVKIGIAHYYDAQSAQLKEIEGYSLPALEEAKQNITKLTSSLGGFIDDIIDVSLDNTYGYYVNGNGVITSTAGNYGIRKGTVEEGHTYLITASSNWSNPFYAWFDSNDNLISVGGSSSAGSDYTYIKDYEAIAPANAASIIINWNTSSEKGFLKESLGEKLAGKWYGMKWACVGDSLTDTNQYTNKHYFDYIADKTDITPVNMGDSGTGYARGYDTDRAFYQRILDCPTDADVVTIFGSFNDLGAGLPTGEYTDIGTSTIAGCINTTLDNLQSVIPAVVVGIIAPTPWQTTQPTPLSAGDTYVNLLKAICEHRSIPFLDLYRESNLRPWDADFRALCYSNDGGAGAHPNDLGHKIIAPKIEAFLDKLLLH